jgi:subfamily B ATP-binding cassette protein MsbA
LPDAKTSVDEVIEALKLADAYDFVMEKGGVDAQLTDMGMNLSGGQRQRLSIARAILKKSPVMIFDEATSALDRESEQAIQNTIKKLSENHIIIVIAHRKTSIKDADSIIELKNGTLLNEA